MGSRNRELELRSRLSTCERRTGDGDRRVQRHRSLAHAAQFQKYVSEHKIHYYITSGGGFGGGPGGGGTASTTSQITSWVQNNFSATTIGGATVYDLS